MDAKLIQTPAPRISWEGSRPLVRVPPRHLPEEQPSAEKPASCRQPDVRRLIRNALRRYHLDRFFRVPRPYDQARPGPFQPAIAKAVQSAGFEYMWTKAAFGRSEPAFVMNDFVALPFTAGHWDGWSPFYTVQSTAHIRAAERRLVRAGRPAWLASNVDSILWMLPGEVLENGRALFHVAQLVANGGHSGRLTNVTPNLIARYARMLTACRGELISRTSYS